MNERYELTIERIRTIIDEETVDIVYRDYFKKVAGFILEIHDIWNRIQEKPTALCKLEELQKENENIYRDVNGSNYEESYANPTYAVAELGEKIGKFLCVLYAEIRSEIPHVYEQRLEYLTICNELFIEVYNCFENAAIPEYKELRDIMYWYASDYCDVYVADDVAQRLSLEGTFARNIIMNSNLENPQYLYQFGEYISEEELAASKLLSMLSQEEIDQMAETCTEDYCWKLEMSGMDLSKLNVVKIQYTLGLERVMRKIVDNLAHKNLHAVFIRTPVNIVTRGQKKNGYCGGTPNVWYEFDHRMDQGIFLDKKFIERKLDVIKNTYEQHKEMAGRTARTFSLDSDQRAIIAMNPKMEAVTLDEKQKKWQMMFESKLEQLREQYGITAD